MTAGLALGLTACSDTNATTHNEAPETKVTETSSPAEKPVLDIPAVETVDLAYEADAIYLERMYATSTNKYGVENLLDGDPNTYWEAMPGAGEDEGVMLYFDPPVYISDVAVALAKTKKSGLRELSVYANGSFAGDFRVKDKEDVDQEVSTLFLRVAQMNNSYRTDFRTEEMSGTVETSNSEQILRLGEIKLYGKGGTPLKVRPLHRIPGSVTASSFLKPAEAYHPDYLFDSRKAFGWAEGNASSGTGEYLDFHFDKSVSIKKLKLWNGYQRSASHFSKNERAKTIQFGKKGATGSSHNLADEDGATVIDLGEGYSGQDFRLKIEAIYPGKSYTDLVLSELRFFDGERWFALQTQGAQKRKSALVQRCKGTPLEAILDRSVNQESNRYDSNVDANRFSNRNLTLRSNSSFVLYLDDSEFGGSHRSEISQVADGNWEIVEIGPKKARIKIFGKVHRIMDREEFYKKNGKSASNKTRIFKEFLTIDKDWVRGEKMVDAIRTHVLDSDMVPCNKYANVLTDFKYMTEDNFMEEVLYDECHECYLREATARALGKAQKLLREKTSDSHRFLIWDAYRPYSVQKRMWEKISDPKYVADPYNGGSSHNKGMSVDLTIVDKDPDMALEMPTKFDFFGPEAHHNYNDLSEKVKANRKLLRDVMEASGF
ncbi:MAG: M15 family metallopeptidase, partial [Bacteroidota bacterium]